MKSRIGENVIEIVVDVKDASVWNREIRDSLTLAKQNLSAIAGLGSVVSGLPDFAAALAANQQDLSFKIKSLVDATGFESLGLKMQRLSDIVSLGIGPKLNEIQRSLNGSVGANESMQRALSMISSSQCALASIGELQNFSAALMKPAIDAMRIFENSQVVRLAEFSSFLPDVGTALKDLLAPNTLSLLNIAPREFFAHSHAVTLVSATTEQALEGSDFELVEDLAEEAKEELGIILPTFNPDLESVWLGAHDVFRSSGRDRLRHTGISLRELLREVLHRLAPDGAVQSWSTSPEHYWRNRPTRAARVEYILKDVGGTELKDLIRLDVKSVTELYAVLDKLSHTVPTLITERQVEAIIYRTEQLIVYLLKVAGH